MNAKMQLLNYQKDYVSVSIQNIVKETFSNSKILALARRNSRRAMSEWQFSSNFPPLQKYSKMRPKAFRLRSTKTSRNSLYPPVADFDNNLWWRSNLGTVFNFPEGTPFSHGAFRNSWSIPIVLSRLITAPESLIFSWLITIHCFERAQPLQKA